VAITLYPPGTRGPYWYAVIRARGRSIEISTKTRDRKLAGRVAERAEIRLFGDVDPGGTDAPLRTLIDAYIRARRPSRNDERYLIRLRRAVGELTTVDQAAADATAQWLYPGATPETWNRQVFTPLSAVLRHHGRSVAFRRPKQKKPRHRALTAGQRDALIAAASHDAELKALLAVLFFTGARISEAIALTWDRVDLSRRVIWLDVKKIDEEHARPMPERLVAALANVPRTAPGPVPDTARVFRWRGRAGPRKALAHLRKATGIPFTWHMARHTFATLLVDAGANIRDVQDAGGWSSINSVTRYIARDVERLRRQVDKL
jgi:integrase